MSEVQAKPILHRAAYDRLIAREVEKYFDDVIFAPILDILRDYRVPVDRSLATVTNVRENDGDFEVFPPELESLNIERSDMPQIAAEDRGSLIQFLAARGISYAKRQIRACDCKPSQRGCYRSKVEKAKEHEGRRSILLSSDCYIFDGHHQWFAQMEEDAGEPIDAIQFDVPFRSLKTVVEKFPSVYRVNALSAVIAALQSDQIHYADGAFNGKFNASLSRELRELGARTSSVNGRLEFLIPQHRLPMALQSAVTDSKQRGHELHAAILAFIAAALLNTTSAPTGIKLTAAKATIAADLNAQAARTLAPLVEQTTETTPAQLREILEELDGAVEESAKVYVRKRLDTLKDKITKNDIDGARTGKLGGIIEKERAMAKRKAETSAGQAVSNSIADFREQLYVRFGSDRYIWQTMEDDRVRPTPDYPAGNHRALNRRVFRWDSPPIDYPGTGARHHPGQAPGCRCHAIPLIRIPTA